MAAERVLCPYLAAAVEISAERAEHIAERHPELLPEHMAALASALADPDTVRRSRRMPTARLFCRWCPGVHGGKHVVVVVVSERGPSRHWVVTAT